jgi:RND superfamily putative drug exporter
MLDRIVRYATSRPKRVIAAWLVVALALGALGGIKAYGVTTDDTAEFLPKGSESGQALQYGRQAFGERKGTSTVTVVLKRSDGRPLQAADRAAPAALAETSAPAG